MIRVVRFVRVDTSPPCPTRSVTHWTPRSRIGHPRVPPRDTRVTVSCARRHRSTRRTRAESRRGIHCSRNCDSSGRARDGARKHGRCRSTSGHRDSSVGRNPAVLGPVPAQHSLPAPAGPRQKHPDTRRHDGLHGCRLRCRFVSSRNHGSGVLRRVGRGGPGRGDGPRARPSAVAPTVTLGHRSDVAAPRLPRAQTGRPGRAPLHA
jgi:hypothetical protein